MKIPFPFKLSSEKEEEGDLRKTTGWEARCLHAVSVVKVGKVRDQEVGMEGHAFMLHVSMERRERQDTWVLKMSRSKIWFCPARLHTSARKALMLIERATSRGGVTV